MIIEDLAASVDILKRKTVNFEIEKRALEGQVRTYHGEINKVVVKLDHEQRAVHNLEAEKRKSENMLKLLQVKLVEAVEE